MRDKATGIPKSAKRFSEQDARPGNRHPEKCEAVFGARCATRQPASQKVRSGFRSKMRDKATGIPKSAKRFSGQAVGTIPAVV